MASCVGSAPGSVWQLEIQGGGLLVIPKPTLLAEMEKYAAKQKARVGRG